ncbi:MAG: hypothetical protein M0Z71_00735 [Nitrospiraceae bacterium]|nr:hypothetical protein [Nitrospiraceae bacterium]
MGKPNFGFQKRQKELARQKKKEEKKQRKLERSTEDAADLQKSSEGGGAEAPQENPENDEKGSQS